MSEKTVYLVAGGRPPDMKQMTQAFHRALEACGKPSPRVAYVGTANGDSKLFFQYMKRPLLQAGAGEVCLAPIVKKRGNLDAVRRMLSEADAVFLSGGEVEDGVVWLQKTGLDALLSELYNEGKIFFGLSAGCIMMGRHWVHWDVADDDSTARLIPCLGLVPFVFDTHCENEDWKELKCALRLLGPGARGYGLATGGFYSADSAGRLTSFRNEPAVFRNADGEIQPEGAS